jgi:hypothetical protein
MWIEPLPTRFDEFQWTVYQLGTGGTPWPRDVADVKNQYRPPQHSERTSPVAAQAPRRAATIGHPPGGRTAGPPYRDTVKYVVGPTPEVVLA